MFELVSARYEKASMIVTSNKPFSKWGEIFGDDAVATAMIDRLVHHADILSLKGDSYRLKGKELGPRPTPPRRPLQTHHAAGGFLRSPTARSRNHRHTPTLKWPRFQPAKPA